MLNSVAALILLQAIVLPGLIVAQPEADIYDRIRVEGTKNSQVMKTLSMLTDVYGPRLTGSPQLKAAGEWAAKQMTDWGMQNAALEPWDFGRPGWVNERASGFTRRLFKTRLCSKCWRGRPARTASLKAKHSTWFCPIARRKKN